MRSLADRKFCLENPRIAFGVLAGYFALHIVLRSLISPSMQTDEAEQSFVTQVWLWGYGSQPPLYTWLQIPLFHLFGVGVFALALLKNVLLFTVYLFTYLTARAIFRDPGPALLATFSLFLIPLFAWESQRDQTHLVLATALGTATVFVAVRLLQTPGTGGYCLLGVLGGLGVLAKYNYAVLLAALLLAALSLPAARAVLFDRRSFLTLLCGALVVAPHAHWAWTHPTLLFSQSGKFHIPQSGNFLLASVQGGALMLKRIADYALLPVAVFALIALRAPRIATAGADPRLIALIGRTLAIGLGWCLVLVMLFHVTAFRARWLQPWLISLPLLLVAWVQPRLDRRRINLVFAVASLVMIVVPTVMYGRIAGTAWVRHVTNLNVPYRAFADQIRAAGFTRGVIVCDGHLAAGNLRPWFLDCPILVPDNIQIPVAHAAGLPVLLVWQDDHRSDLSRALLDFATQRFDVAPTQSRPQTITAPALYAPNLKETLKFAIFPPRATATDSHRSFNAATP